MNLKGHTILLVDDDADDLFFMTSIIHAAYPDLFTAVAGNGTEALHYLHAAKQRGQLPALVLMDINMPRMNGKEALALIKADTRLSRVPVVIFSTSNLPSDRLYCAHYGTEMITKPSTTDDLDRVLQKLLNGVLYA